MAQRLVRWQLRVTVIVMLACAGLLGCNHGADESVAHSAFPPVAVLVAKAMQKNVPNQLQAIGTVEAFAIVGIKALRCQKANSSRLISRKATTSLAASCSITIDPRPFQADLNQAKANMVRDMATAHQASVDEQRYSTLWRQGVGSRYSNTTRVMRPPPVPPPRSPPIAH